MKILRSPNDVARLGSKLASEHRLSGELSTMIIFVIQPRVHPLTRTTYGEVDVFRYSAEGALKLGTYRSDESDIAALFLSFISEGVTPPERELPR